MEIDGRHVSIFGNAEAKNVIIEPVDERDFSTCHNQVELLRRETSEEFMLVAFLITNWNEELTPWKSEPVFGKIGFGEGAKNTLSFLLDKLLPALNEKHGPGKSFYLCGYSLAALFALWSAYQSDSFAGVAAVSPSMWYPGWEDFARSHEPLVNRFYLSLGDKEARARNPIMATVADRIKTQHQLLCSQGIDCIMEWNPGNHFVDSDIRLVKGMNWLLAH